MGHCNRVKQFLDVRFQEILAVVERRCYGGSGCEISRTVQRLLCNNLLYNPIIPVLEM